MHFSRLALAAPGTVFAAGCHTWRVRPTAVTSGIERALRVTTSDRQRFTLDRAVARADSVVGYLRVRQLQSGSGWLDVSVADGERIAIATADIVSLEDLVISRGRTIALGIGLVTLTMAALAAALAIAFQFSW